MANPAPWAVTAFGTTSFMLGMYQTNILDSAGILIVLPAAFFDGRVQIIVAVLEFNRGNMFGGAVFGTYGPFWVIFGAFQTLYATSVPASALSSATSLFLAVFAVVTFYLAVASLRTDLVPAVILWLIFLGLVLLSIGAGTSNIDVTTPAAGWSSSSQALPGTTPRETASSPPSGARSCRSACAAALANGARRCGPR